MSIGELKILTPVGMLGYGFPKEDFWRGIERGASAIVVDSGSTDPGPYLLGLGKTIVPRAAFERDLSIALEAVVERRIPLLIGSAGGSGLDRQVDEMSALVAEIGRRLGRPLKILTISSEVGRDEVHRRRLAGAIDPCASAPPLRPADVDEATAIVAQMGVEPFVAAIEAHPDYDVIVAGRAYDPAPFAALCARAGIEPGVAWHMGKIMECGAACAEPKGSVILATIRSDSFDLEPMDPNARCTVLSVAAHTLYEKTRPDLLYGPGGVLDLTRASYEQIDDRTVRVRGSTFVPSETYRVKLEGAALEGYRTIFVAGVRDPIFIEAIDRAFALVRRRLGSLHPEFASGAASIAFHAYGKNGVMGDLEPLAVVPHELGILGEVTAPSQDLADAIASDARITLLHMPYDGQKATSGNIALPLNPPESPIGPVFRFSIYHLMDVDSPTALFPIRVFEA